MRVTPGILAAIGAAALFGLSTPLAKILVGSVAPLLLAGLLYLGSGIGIAMLIALRLWRSRGTANITWPRGHDLWWLLGAIIAGGVVGPYLQMFGLQYTDAASASLILNLEGVFTALLAWFVFRENFDRRIAVGMLLIIAGGVALSLGPRAGALNLMGPIAIAGACLAWGIDNNLTRKVALHDAMLIAGTKGLAAGTTSVTLALAYGARLPDADVIAAAAVVGFLGYGLSLTLFVLALRDLGTARTGAYFSLAPFVGAAFAIVVGAPMTVALAVAAVLMGIGVWLHLSERHEHMHAHTAEFHDHLHSHDDGHHTHQHESAADRAATHAHPHEHLPMTHTHAHFPDAHHRHDH